MWVATARLHRLERLLNARITRRQLGRIGVIEDRGLLEHKELLRFPGAGQGFGNRLQAGLAGGIAQLRQGHGVALTGDNGADDRHLAVLRQL